MKMGFNLLPVEGNDFVNREELLNKMLYDLKNKKSNLGYALFGKRRIGKTSIFLEIKRRLKEERDVIPVYFSFWELTNDSIYNFIKEFTAEVLDSYSKHLSMLHKAKNLLKASLSIIKETVRSLNISIKLKDEIELLLTFEKSGEDYSKLIEDCFNLPEELAKETNTKCVLLLDEFPAIMDLKDGEKVGENLIRKIRTIHERQKNTSLCISGSIRKTMEMVALSPVSAFYRQFIIKEVKPLEKEDVKKLIQKNLERKKINDKILDEIYKFSAGIPFYIQFIGREIERYENITIDILKKAINEFLGQEGNILFKEEFLSLSSKEKTILIAISNGNNTPSKIAEFNSDKTPNVSRFLTYLEEKGYVSKKEKGFYVIDDNVFERWLKQKYQT